MGARRLRSSGDIATGSHLLQSLPASVRSRLRASVEGVALGLGDILFESGERLEHAYFPTDCIVSLVRTMEDGRTGEIGIVGNEGVVGIALFLGGETRPSRAVVQVAGAALRMPAADLQGEFHRGGAFQRAMLRYTQAQIAQISQTAVCNRLHHVEQRLCRWLLMARDRVRGDEIAMTQEFIAQMLGVRREGVSEAAAHLQDAGLIHYARGHIQLLDRAGLEAASCECYRVVKDEFARLLDR